MTVAARLSVAAALLALLAGGFFYYPGSTFLQSDTQIYLPILDRLADPTLYRHDPVAYRPHVSYTIYDEAARGLRALAGLGFREALTFQQLLWRLGGLFGAFLLGRACRLSVPWSILFAAIYGLGATIAGPSVLIAEYEPVPRGFAVALLMLAIGLASQERWTPAGLAAGLAILYHPPTTLPVLFCGAFAIWPARRWRMAAPIAGAILLVYALSRLQQGATEPQQFFAAIGPELERLQRLRGSYNFVSIWIGRWATHWIFVVALALLSWWRLRHDVPPFVARLALSMTIYGVAMLPLSYLLLEQAKWSLMPQLQPVRALLWATLWAMLGATLNGIRASQTGRASVAILWFAAAYGLSGHLDLARLPALAFGDAVMRTRLLVFLGLGALAFAAVRWNSRVILAVALATPLYLIPQIGKVRNYRELDHPEIHALADWARAHTGKDAVFQFPDADQALYPGLFRVYAQRNVYADWKGGGQVNLLKEFADEWWRRWQAAGAPGVDPQKLGALGIDFAVMQPAHRWPDRTPVYKNSRYVVYALR